jgi:hypothetical protein
MQVRLDGKIQKARITTDNPEHKWEIRLESGRSFFARDALEESGLQIVQCTDREWEHLATAGFQPPYQHD